MSAAPRELSVAGKARDAGDCAKAIEYYKKAWIDGASNGYNQTAAFYLGNLYARGKCASSDRSLARDWYQKYFDTSGDHEALTCFDNPKAATCGMRVWLAQPKYDSEPSKFVDPPASSDQPAPQIDVAAAPSTGVAQGTPQAANAGTSNHRQYDSSMKNCIRLIAGTNGGSDMVNTCNIAIDVKYWVGNTIGTASEAPSEFIIGAGQTMHVTSYKSWRWIDYGACRKGAGIYAADGRQPWNIPNTPFTCVID